MKKILLKPLITEKVTAAQEKYNKYAFKVARTASKGQVRSEIESFYNVKVLSVKTAILPGKTKRMGKSVKKTSSFKKAFVTLEAGQEIKLFTGV